LLVGGQRGTLMHGTTEGRGFRKVPTQSKGSITAVTVAGRTVLAVGLDGLMMKSSDGGERFEESQSVEGLSLTAALLDPQGAPVLFSRRGVLFTSSTGQ